LKKSICDPVAVENAVSDYDVDTIVNFAAESHVDNSISGPQVFFDTNVMGVVNLLEVCRKHGCRLHQVSTDEVYGISTPDSNINEYSNLNPSSPYSSSKASADLICMSYAKTFNLPVTISRCTNNAGKYQHCEKLIGTVISAAIKNKNIPVYGNGLQKRHWTYVADHNNAILNIIKFGQLGKIYNIGPCNENYITNIELIKFILHYLNKPETLITYVNDRLAHDTSYYLTPSSNICIANSTWKKFMPHIIEWYAQEVNNNN